MIEDNAKKEAEEEKAASAPDDPYKNPYPIWQFSKWFWWNILERGRVNGDE